MSLMNLETTPAAEKIKLDYAALEQEIIELFSRSRLMVLATAADGRVTARMMSVVNRGLDIFMQVAADSTKGEQMQKNDRVALCINNIQVEGRAVFCGHASENANAFFVSEYGRVHKGSFDTYSHLKTEQVVCVHPERVTLWKYDEQHKPLREFLDIAEKSAWREYYPLD